MLVTSGLFYAIVPSGATLALRVLSSFKLILESYNVTELGLLLEYNVNVIGCLGSFTCAKKRDFTKFCFYIDFWSRFVSGTYEI